MPSGREIHTPQVYSPPSLDEETLAKMRAPFDNDAENAQAEDDKSSDDDERSSELPGSFPVSASATGASYY